MGTSEKVAYDARESLLEGRVIGFDWTYLFVTAPS
jgi:hypothetical protein